MLKAGSKRRRTKVEIEEEEKAKVAKELEMAAQLAKVSILEQQNKELSEKANQGSAASMLMSQLIEAGLMKQEAENTFTIHGSHGDKSFNI